MKFLCDRCKTRYSIGDDRVRGKILKIRCKNCANVITVREGMTDVEVADGGERPKATTMSQSLAGAAPANGALGAAFASALTTKPPAALEEEWYVSDDGAQEGPYSLTEAQEWVTAKPHDADLHCWSEGFDDWLPVDKVSHFRGLRKKPAPAPTPPPMPRSTASGGRAPTRTVDDEPKPLFAATMASLEKSAPAPSAAAVGGHGLGLPPTRPTPTPIQARSNGSQSVPLKIPAPISGPATLPSGLAGLQPRTSTTPGVGSKVQPFDGDQPTQIESAPFAAAAPEVESHDEDDELAIGEVSRVVNLADLMASGPKPRPAAAVVSNRTGPMARLGQTGPVQRLSQTGMVPRLGQTGAVARIADPNVPAGPAVVGQNDMAAAPATHRRGLFMLIGAAALLLAGVVIAVVVLVFGGESFTSNTLAGGDTIDTTRPDDPTRKTNPNGSGPGSAVNPFFPPKQPIKRPTNPNISTNPNPGNGKLEPELPSGSLRSDEIEDMARKFSTGTQRCYMRSQKGADAILIGDVKKIQATLDIGTDGVVKNVTLSAHSTNNLGKCLISTIKSWKFRTSPGGLYKISLQFVAG
ncbi:MAG: zinc-ribbon domain-containing protein [Deltaproteobacteria bacterium]|nr:zinc-ribbon domain-containing protein [Deltaproteobacteria bacterium]